MMFRFFVDGKTMDTIADRVFALGGSIPATWCASVPREAVEQFTAWIDHLGVEYEKTRLETQEIEDPLGLVASHIRLATFGRGWL